jgi:hypothetical protein
VPEPALLQGPDPDLVVLMVPIQALIGGDQTLGEDLDIVSERLHAYFHPHDPHFQTVETRFQSVETPFQRFEAPINPAELPGEKIDKLGVLVGGHGLHEGMKRITVPEDNPGSGVLPCVDGTL